MHARIYQPARSAMQSGRAKTESWVLEFEGKTDVEIDPLTGTASSSNTLKQVKLKFDTLEQAVSYAQERGIPYRVKPSQERKRISRSYAENFDYDRKHPWTH